MNLGELFSFFANQELTDEFRQMGLVYDAQVTSVLGPALLPQRAHIKEGICQDFEARITCFTTNVALPVKSFIGVPLALSIGTDQGTKRLYPMIVTEAERGHSTGDVTAVHLVGRDPMAIMDQRRCYRVFSNRSAVDVVCDVLDDWIANTAIGPSLDYSLPGLDLDRYPKRANIIQYADESDAAFVKRLLASEGVAWFWRPQALADTSDGSLPALELVLFDDGTALRPNDAPVMRYHRRDATELTDTIDLLSEVWELVPTNTTLSTWDHKTARMDARVGTANVDFGDAGIELSHALDHVRVVAPHLGNDWDDLDRLAQARANHDTFRSHCLRGRSGVRTMAPGTYQVIEGYAPFESLDPDACKFVCVTVEAFTENNLPTKLYEPAQALMGDEGVPEWARVDAGKEGVKSEQRFTNRFTCVPITAPIAPAYADEADEQRRRRLTGLVVAATGEVSCDGLARVSVQLVGAQAGADTVTCQRGVVPWGGRDHGHVLPLRDGTEVDLEWTGRDRLVIVGVHYNGKTPPPLFDHLAGLPANVALSGVITRELNGAAQQQLRFNDSPGNISVQLGTDAAATQLNLGALSTPMDQGETTPRGAGFELRSDKAGAIRTAEALLLSTYARLQASGHQLDVQEHVDLLKGALELLEGLGKYAADHQGGSIDTAASTQLKAAVESGTEPTLSLAGLAGVATSTPRTIFSYAGTNIDSVAMANFQQTAGGFHVVNAGKGLSLFAHAGGVKTIAHHGPLLMQSQHDDTQIDAGKDLKVTAAQKAVFIADEITLMTTGGAFLSLKGGKVKIGGSEPLDVNTDGHNWNGPATMSGDLPTFSDGDLGRVPRLLRPTDGKPASGIKLEINRDEAGKLSGETDASGTGAKVTANGLQRLKNLFFVPRS